MRCASEPNGFGLSELTDMDCICGIYDIYRHCMFMPTEEKFRRKMEAYLKDDSVRIFACSDFGKTGGVIAVSFQDRYRIEILGIAVEESARNRGIGSRMITWLMDRYGLTSVFAETDKDAVGFYRKNGFDVAETVEAFGGKTAVRYRCEWTR